MVEQERSLQEILVLNPGQHKINFDFQRNYTKISILSANNVIKFHITMSLQYSVINYGKRPAF